MRAATWRSRGRGRTAECCIAMSSWIDLRDCWSCSGCVWDWVSGGSTASIRVMAMLFGGLLVVSTGVIVRALVGESAARWAVIICAVVSSAPVLEGYAANGELLSGAVSAAGLAVGVVALSRRHRFRWFFASGLLAGVALSLKQSGFDGSLALAIGLGLGVLFCAGERQTALKSMGALAAGIATIVGALMLHGALTDWSRWWAAVVGYRFHTQSAFTSADWQNLVANLPYAAVVLGASALLALIGVRRVGGRPASARGGSAPRAVLLGLSFVSAALAFLVGGGYWRHYWLLLAAPLSALAGAGLVQLAKFRRTALAAALAPCLAITAWVYAGDQAHINIRAAGDRRAATDEVVAVWFDQSTPRTRRESLRVVRECRRLCGRTSGSRLSVPLGGRCHPSPQRATPSNRVPQRPEARAALHRRIPNAVILRPLWSGRSDLAPRIKGRRRVRSVFSGM